MNPIQTRLKAAELGGFAVGVTFGMSIGSAGLPPLAVAFAYSACIVTFGLAVWWSASVPRG